MSMSVLDMPAVFKRTEILKFIVRYWTNKTIFNLKKVITYNVAAMSLQCNKITHVLQNEIHKKEKNK